MASDIFTKLAGFADTTSELPLLTADALMPARSCIGAMTEALRRTAPMNAPVKDSVLVAAKDAAGLLGLPYTTLRKLAHEGVIDPVMIGRAWYFKRQDIDALPDKLTRSFITKNLLRVRY